MWDANNKNRLLCLFGGNVSHLLGGETKSANIEDTCMNAHHLPIICLMAASIVCAADAQETNRNSWHPNTRLLDDTKHGDPVSIDATSTLARDVKSFYELLRDKHWHETYQRRAKAFREDVLESDYIQEAKKAEKLWGLVNYEVLSGEFSNTPPGTNVDQAILICKFTELPGYTVSYSTVFWHKENGVWKCLSAGPHKLGIFRGTRPPFINWK